MCCGKSLDVTLMIQGDFIVGFDRDEVILVLMLFDFFPELHDLIHGLNKAGRHIEMTRFLAGHRFLRNDVGNTSGMIEMAVRDKELL
ncbi:hypothetical protein D3C72_1524200 [compost metagenome]